MKKCISLALMLMLVILSTGCAYREDPGSAAPKSSESNLQRSVDNSDALLSEDEVKSIVLSHAALSEADIKYYTSHLDYDDDFARYEYEVSFHADQYEYDYEVDALSGKIIDFDKEHIYD